MSTCESIRSTPSSILEKLAAHRVRGTSVLLAGLLAFGLADVIPNEATAQTAYTAVWRKGGGAQWWRTGMSGSQFKSQDLAYFKRGLRLVDVEIRSGRYTAVWRPGRGEQRWRSGMSRKQFKAQDLAYFKRGLRLVDVEIVSGKYFAVWRPGRGEQRWRSGMTGKQFKAQDLAYFRKGLRLVDVEIRSGRYFAVWRPGRGAQWWRPRMTWRQFVAQDKAYFRKGLRLVDLEIVSGRYFAVWRRGGGAQWAYGGMCSGDTRTTDAAYFRKGLRLVDLELHSNPAALYRLPFDNDGGWVLGNANWDDPVKPGHGGKKTGLQAYAFDFGHATGGTVRAARAGTVYALVKSESGNNKSCKNKCNPGVGNFVVIRHSDGTFATYWHLQKNGVHVKVGNRVRRGQKIATSGNTGCSSGPHLHFDVRKGWDKAYSCSNLSEMPSVRVYFQDRNHRCWIPRRGDSLRSNNK